MMTIVVALLAVAAMILAQVLLKRWEGSTHVRDSSVAIGYTSKPLLTEAERRFQHALRPHVPDSVLLCAKVRLLDVLEPPKGKQRQTSLNRVSSKHLDFVLVDVATSRVLVAIELDDRSHERAKRRQRDEFLEAAMRSAQVPLCRIPAATHYDRGALGSALQPYLPAPPVTA